MVEVRRFLSASRSRSLPWLLLLPGRLSAAPRCECTTTQEHCSLRLVCVACRRLIYYDKELRACFFQCDGARHGLPPLCPWSRLPLHVLLLHVSQSVTIGDVAYATALDVGDVAVIRNEDAASIAIAFCHPLPALQCYHLRRFGFGFGIYVPDSDFRDVCWFWICYC